jgi:hypothetical protein
MRLALICHYHHSMCALFAAAHKYSCFGNIDDYKSVHAFCAFLTVASISAAFIDTSSKSVIHLQHGPLTPSFVTVCTIYNCTGTTST